MWVVLRPANPMCHYGILGMKWGIRKDEVEGDVWDYINQERSINDLSLEDFEGSRFDEPFGLKNFVGMSTHPWEYEWGDQEELADRSICETGVKDFFNKSLWDQSSERDKQAVSDYISYEGCKIMNSLLRGVISESDAEREYGVDKVSQARESIDLFSSMLDDTTSKSRSILSRRTNTSGLAGLLGVNESDLSDKDVLSSLIGSRCVEPGFLSTSLARLDSNIGEDFGNVKMYINARKGSSGMFIEPGSGMSSLDRGTYEVTLNRGSVFDVAGINVNPSTGQIEEIMLDLIGTDDEEDLL